MGVLPKWLALPVEHRCLTAEEAQIILSLANRHAPPERMSDEELAAVLRLQHWTALASDLSSLPRTRSAGLALVMMETEGVLPS